MQTTPAGAPEAVLLIAFGAGQSGAAAAYRQIGNRCRLRFPGTNIRWAFTVGSTSDQPSAFNRRTDPPAVALERLLRDGCRQVAVQFLNLIPGIEFIALVRDIDRIRAACPQSRITIGSPLLAGEADCRKMARVMTRDIAPPARRPDQAVVWFGHGSRHPAGQALYRALDEALRRHDPHTMLGTVADDRSWDRVALRLRQLGTREVWLRPFLTETGKLARFHTSGDPKTSWRCRLEAMGIHGLPLPRSLSTYDSMIELWLDRLVAAWRATGGERHA